MKEFVNGAIAKARDLQGRVRRSRKAVIAGSAQFVGLVVFIRPDLADEGTLALTVLASVLTGIATYRIPNELP